MAKKELYRKIIATVLTVAVLGCLLGIGVWLLLGSNVFSSTLHTVMLICTLALAIAIIGLIVCKIQEIRTLQEIIRHDEQKNPQGSEEDLLDQLLEPITAHAQAVATAVDNSPLAQVESVTLPFEENPLPSSLSPESISSAASQNPSGVEQNQLSIDSAPSATHTHSWKPINFNTLKETTPQKQPHPQTMQEQIRPAAPVPDAQTLHQQEEQKRQLILNQAKQLQEERRTQQIQLAQEARMGSHEDIIHDETYLTALARQAQAQQQMMQASSPSFVPVNEAVLADSQSHDAHLQEKEQVPPLSKPTILDEMKSEMMQQPVLEETPTVVQKLNVKPIAWPAPPPPSKIFVTTQIPAVTDEIIAAERARQAAQNAAGEWKKNS